MKRPSRRTLAWLAAAVVAAALVAGLVWLWLAPAWAPQVVRRTPAGETLAYVNLRPLRAAGWLQAAPKTLAPPYAAFEQASGFHFERDLDAAACTLLGSPVDPAQTTCVLEGRFAPAFLDYLQSHAQRHFALAGQTAYQFPGWSHPDKPMWVVMLGGGYLVASNAGAAAAPGVVQWAASGWHRSPALWQPGADGATLGYLSLDAQRLAAARALNGAAAPWRGAETLHVGVSGSAATGVSLAGRLQLASAGDAAAAQTWIDAELAALRVLLQPSADHLSAATLLDRLQLRLNGTAVELSLHLDPATVQQLLPAAAGAAPDAGR